MFLLYQFAEIVPKFSSPEEKETAFTPLDQMVCPPLMYSVTKQKPVEDGRCFKRDLRVRLISTSAGTTKNMALAT